MKKRWPGKDIAGYAGVLLGCFLIAIVAGWTSFANQIDSDVYDWMVQRNPPPHHPSEAVVLMIDDATFGAMGGVRNLRGIAATALERIAPDNGFREFLISLTSFIKKREIAGLCTATNKSLIGGESASEQHQTRRRIGTIGKRGWVTIRGGGSRGQRPWSSARRRG